MSSTPIGPLPAAVDRRTVKPFSMLYRVLLREIVTPGRLGVIGALTLVAVLASFAIGRSSSEGIVEAQRAAEFVEIFGLVVVVPIIALVFATAVIGDLREDQTLVYLWLRPMPSWLVPSAALAAAATVVVPAVAVPLGASAAIAGGDADVVVGTLVASAVGAVAYCAVFLAASVVLSRVLLWGLAYVLIWEGFIASSDGAARLAIRAYTSSILADVSSYEVGLGIHSTTTALLVLVPVTIVSMAITVWRYSTSTVD